MKLQVSVIVHHEFEFFITDISNCKNTLSIPDDNKYKIVFLPISLIKPASVASIYIFSS